VGRLDSRFPSEVGLAARRGLAPQLVARQTIRNRKQALLSYRFVRRTVPNQASEALAILLCHPAGADGGNFFNNASSGGRLQAGMGYPGGGVGSSSGAAASAATRENEVHWKRLMFFFDM